MHTPVASRRRAPWLLLLAPLAVLGACVALPALLLLRTSFRPGSGPASLPGWTLAQWAAFLGDAYYLQALGQTLAIAALTTALCLLFGAPVGYSLARLPPAKRRWRVVIVILPLSLSLVVVVFGWLVILGRTGLLNRALLALGLVDSPQRLLFSTPAVILVLVQQFLPYMVLSVMSVCAQIDPVLEQAAANLRANRWRTIRRIVLPLAMPGLVSGSTLVFVLASAAFLTPRMVGGTRVQMLGSLVYDQVLVILNWPFGAAIAAGLLIVVLGALGFANVLLAGAARQVSVRRAG